MVRIRGMWSDPAAPRGGVQGIQTASRGVERPEAVSLQDPGNGCNRLGGTVEDVAFLGAVVRIKVGLGQDRIVLDRFNSPGLPPPVPGESVTLHFSPDDLVPLDPA